MRELRRDAVINRWGMEANTKLGVAWLDIGLRAHYVGIYCGSDFGGFSSDMILFILLP